MNLSITSTADGLCARIAGVGLERLQQLRELNRDHGLGLRQRHQLDLRLDARRQASLRAHHQLREIERNRRAG